MKQKKRPAMADVSKLSGVTTMTVSRFFSGKAIISEDTQAAIIEACKRLGFKCAQCGTIGQLPVNLVLRGEHNYLCGFECCRKFIAKHTKAAFQASLRAK